MYSENERILLLLPPKILWTWHQNIFSNLRSRICELLFFHIKISEKRRKARRILQYIKKKMN